MISRTTAAIIAVIAFAIGMGVGAFAYIQVTAGSGEASISAADAAATLAASQPTRSATTAPTVETRGTVDALSTELAAANATITASGVTGAATVAATTAATTEATEAVATTEAAVATEAVAVASTGATTYSIDSTQSEVRFTLQEDLRGETIDVIGTTKDVGGDITVDLAQPQNSSINPIVINARTLETPEDMRNNAIRSRILRSADAKYEFITFTPTAITGLPTSAVTSGPLTFQVTGDLKIVEVTKSVTFDVTISEISDTQISGTGKTVVNWADFNLAIPSVPFVANVTPEVTLEIDFVALAAK